MAFGPLNMGLENEQVLERVDEALGSVRMQAAGPRAPYQLSMGERRRVAIATVLAMHPSLLVLDEPSANLDPRARRELLEVLARIDRTMLVTTHDLPLAAELCERAVILAGGRVAADGDCREILGDRRAARPARSRAAGGLRPLAGGASATRYRGPCTDQQGGSGMSEHQHDESHSHEHSHGGETHAHPHDEHDHEHVEHEHEHSHDGETHSHPHVHQEGLEEEHAHEH